MRAYDETYLLGAQRRLGSLLEFATTRLGRDLPVVYSSFLAHPISARFAAGDPAVIAGRSGEELAFEILDVDSPCLPHVDDRVQCEFASPEYWTGWALAFYQWASGCSFEAIERRVRIVDVRSLYTPYHEMDIRQFCDHMDDLCLKAQPQTNLQVRRRAAGLSQSQLARAADMPVRTLQQYEQRQKDLNHARADYVEALARVLACKASDLLERNAKSGYEYALISF